MVGRSLSSTTLQETLKNTRGSPEGSLLTVVWFIRTPFPNNWLAIATTGQDPKEDGFWVFTTKPKPVQKITGLPAIYGMIWDEDLIVGGRNR
jgi:hypothetical protein